MSPYATTIVDKDNIVIYKNGEMEMKIKIFFKLEINPKHLGC